MAQYTQLPSQSTAGLAHYSDSAPRSSAASSSTSPPARLASGSEGDSTDEKELLNSKTDQEEDDELEREMYSIPRSRSDWTDRLSFRPRTVVLSILSVSILVALFVFFHPSRLSPAATTISHDSSSYYSGAPLAIGLYDPSLGQVAKNPLEPDATFSDVPFAQVGASWDDRGRQPEWAGGDGGSGQHEKGLSKEGGRVSNGTHWFEKTVLFITIEGMRPEYLTAELTPNLFQLADKGVHAEYLEPVFPALSAPNHWSILTGLYPSSHGIVSNRFRSPSLSKTFDLESQASVWDSAFYHGEPIYQTALRSNLKVASFMHPFIPPSLPSHSSSKTTKPTYWYPPIPRTHPRKKLAKVLQFLDQSYQKRPQLMLINFEEVAKQVQKSGTEVVGTRSAESDEDETEGKGKAGGGVEKSLKMIDESFFGALIEGLKERNLEGKVEIVVVGDTGMQDVGKEKGVFLDDILDQTTVDKLDQPFEGGSSTIVGLRLEPSGADFDSNVELLRTASRNGEGGFVVYTRDEFPSDWHFSEGDNRLAPVWLVAREGWTLTTRDRFAELGGKLGFKATNGYDPATSESMRSMFVSNGPYSSTLASTQPKAGFSNLQIYEFVANSLDIAVETRALNNGTSGFWDE